MQRHKTIVYYKHRKGALISRNSVRDVILIVLDHVIGSAPVAEEAVLNYLQDEICCFFLGHVGTKSVLQQFYGLSTEAR